MLTNHTEKKEAADRVLYECGLLRELEKIGAVHIVGGYRIGMMMDKGLDIYVENSQVPLE